MAKKAGDKGTSKASSPVSGPSVSVGRGGKSISGQGGGGGFFSSLFGGGGGSNRMPDGSRMDTITKDMGGKSSPVYGQQTLRPAPGTPGLSDKLALNQAAMAAASQPDGIMGVLRNIMPGSMAVRAGQGLMKHMRPASAFPPRFGVDGEMTPYGMQMQKNSQLLAQQMASQGGGDNESFAPSAPSSQEEISQYPQERPAWWPSYLPWPPPSQAGAQYAPPPVVPQIPQMGTQPTGSLPAPTPYGTSYSSLQNAISGAQNPLMMGIGGMLRRP